MSSPPEHPPAAPTWLQGRWPAELLFGVGLAAAVLVLALRPGVVFTGFPEGSDWETYISNTAYVWHGDWPGIIYQDWRKPLHAYLVGLLGEGSSYIHGAQLLTAASLVALVLAAGLLGRALASRPAGVVSALSMAALATLEPASRWVNHYPLLAGSAGLAAAFGAACLRWPRGLWALLAMLCAGLCFAVDGRGVVALGMAAPLVVGAAWTLRARPRRAWGLLALAGLGLCLASAVDQGLQRRYTPGLLSVAEQLGNQRQVILTHYDSVGGAPEPLASACGLGEPAALEGLSLACAVALEAENHRRLSAEGALPPLGFGLLLLLALVPGPRGWRDSLGVAAVVGGAVAALAAGMAWVVYWDRYGLQHVVPLVVLVPVGLDRLVRWGWARWRPTDGSGIPAVIAAASALALALLVWPGWSGSDAGSPALGEAERHPGGADGRLELAAWARGRMGPDDLLIDCAGASLFQLLLPQRIPLARAPWHTPSCREWSREPPSVAGQHWFVTLEPPPGTEDRFGLSPAWMRAQGWEEQALELAPVPGQGTLRVWGRVRGEPQG